MGAAAAIDKQISNYMLQLNPVQKKAVLGIVKAFAAEHENSLDKEIERRFAEMENGSVKGYSLDETEARARKAHKTSRVSIY